MATEVKPKKEDGRVVYSKMRIKSAFYELVQEMDFEKITVTAICAKAEINRATFYKHYLDVYDLLDKLQEDALTSFRSKIHLVDDKSVRDMIVSMLNIIKHDLSDNFSFTSLTAGKDGFTNKLATIIYEETHDLLANQLKDSPIDPNAIYAYISAGSAGLIEYWIRSNYSLSAEEMAELILQLGGNTIRSAQ